MEFWLPARHWLSAITMSERCRLLLTSFGCMLCAGSLPCLWHGAVGAAGHPGHQQLLQHLLQIARPLLAGLFGFGFVFPPAHRLCHVDDGQSAAQHSVQAHAAYASGPCRQIHAAHVCRYGAASHLKIGSHLSLKTVHWLCLDITPIATLLITFCDLQSCQQVCRCIPCVSLELKELMSHSYCGCLPYPIQMATLTMPYLDGSPCSTTMTSCNQA